jgi:hypothetical protein
MLFCMGHEPEGFEVAETTVEDERFSATKKLSWISRLEKDQIKHFFRFTICCILLNLCISALEWIDLISRMNNLISKVYRLNVFF